jgi:hypothetical protein
MIASTTIQVLTLVLASLTAVMLLIVLLRR